jgi:hypothetical protein
VPRKVKRPDGWNPERQRRFIALLAETGSPQRAAAAMGKQLSGVEGVYRDLGAESFRAAWHAALEIAAKREREELAGLGDRPEFEPPHRRQKTADYGAEVPEPEGEGDNHDAKLELIERLIAKFQRKVGQEREERLAGNVVAADFYLRQVTCLEVAFDLMIEGTGMGPWEMMMQARRGGRNMLEIADTYMARVLDQARRDHWAAMDEPERPLLWPERYVIGTRDGDVRIEPPEQLGKPTRAAPGIDPAKWRLMDTAEQQRIYDEQHAENAADQVAWETASRQAYEERRDRDASASARAAKRSAAAKPRDGDRFTPLPIAGPEEDFADRAMREALAAARKAHPDDF